MYSRFSRSTAVARRSRTTRVEQQASKAIGWVIVLIAPVPSYFYLLCVRRFLGTPLPTPALRCRESTGTLPSTLTRSYE